MGRIDHEARAKCFENLAHELANGPLSEDGIKGLANFILLYFGPEWQKHPDHRKMVAVGRAMFEFGIGLTLMDVEGGIISLQTRAIERPKPEGESEVGP